MCASSCLSSSIAKVTSTVYFILLIKSLGSFLNTSLGINIPSLPWFHWPWSLWSRFQTLYWDNHSFHTMVENILFVLRLSELVENILFVLKLSDLVEIILFVLPLPSYNWPAQYSTDLAGKMPDWGAITKTGICNSFCSKQCENSALTYCRFIILSFSLFLSLTQLGLVR